MVSTNPPLSFNTSFDPQTGQAIKISDYITRVTAPNSGPYTFTGTNSFLIGDEQLVIVDPGPTDPDHLAALLKAIDGRPVKAILLTHTHKDHCDLADWIKWNAGEATPLWFEGKHRTSRKRRPFEINLLAGSCDWRTSPDRILADGDLLEIGNISMRVVATPGHCANHLCFGIIDTPYILTGDHVMGWSSTLVATPDGSMADYLASMDHLICSDWTHYLPAHGGQIEEGPKFASALKAHRNMRNAQILAAINAGAKRVSQIVKSLYPAVDAKIARAAAMTVSAHVEYLADNGKIDATFGVFGTRLRPTVTVSTD